MAIVLYFAILAGIGYSVDAQTVQCALLTTDCALNLTEVILDNAKKNLTAAEYTCKAVEDYRQCMKGDGTVNCPDSEIMFQSTLTAMNIDIQALCSDTGSTPVGNTGSNTGTTPGTNTGMNTGGNTPGNTGTTPRGNTGGPASGTTGLSSVLNISLIFIQTVLASLLPY